MSARERRKPRGIFEKKKGSGTWWIRWADENGKIHREKIGPKSLAIAAYQARKTAVRQGKMFPNQIGRQRVVLFHELVEDFLAHSQTNKRSYKHDQGRVRPLLKAFGGRPARAITAQEIEQFKAMLFKTTYIKGGATRPLAPATVKHHIDLLRTIFNVGIKNQKVESNPVLQVTKIKLNNARIRYFVGDEQDRMFAKLPTKYHTAIILALLTGLRSGNLRTLEWERIDLESGTYTIPLSKNGEALHLPFHAQAKEFVASLPRNGNKYVLPGRDGRPMGAGLNLAFANAIQQAGINDFHFHDLRHTFASRLAMEGVDLLTIQKLGGWKTLAMVLRYAHLSPTYLRAELNRLPYIKIGTDTSASTTPISPAETNPDEHGNSAQTGGSASNADPA